jgi:two-component system sensor histidine kinase KdpD
VAESRRREIEALYDLCVDLFTSGATRDGLAAAAGRALRAIGVRSGGLALVGAGGELEPVSWIGSAPDLEVRRLVEFDLEGGAPVAGRPSEWRDLRIPIAIGEHQVGMLVAYGTRADRATLESVGRLVGLAVERERLFAEQARLEALKQSDALKTALLQAVSHDLSTPLTTIAILLESLRRALARHAEGSETVESIHQETARLQRRIENLLAMGRLEAGVFAPRREPTPSADLFRAAREHLALLASTRRLEVHVEPDCPDLDVDPSLVLEILVNLIENAHRSSPPAAAIELRARRHPRSAARVELEVLDRGRGLPPSWDEDGAVGAPPGDAGGMRKGLGLEIALRFAAALGGSVALKARDGGGVRAVIDLPAAALVAQEAAGEP